MKLIDKYREIQKIGTEVEVPFYEVSRLIHGSRCRKLTVVGDQIELGGTDCDIGTLDECRTAIARYVQQLGGTVKWTKETNK